MRGFRKGLRGEFGEFWSILGSAETLDRCRVWRSLLGKSAGKRKADFQTGMPDLRHKEGQEKRPKKKLTFL